MASFSLEDFVGNGVLKGQIDALMVDGWDDVPTLKMMTIQDMEALQLSQLQRVCFPLGIEIPLFGTFKFPAEEYRGICPVVEMESRVENLRSILERHIIWHSTEQVNLFWCLAAFERAWFYSSISSS